MRAIVQESSDILYECSVAKEREHEDYSYNFHLDVILQ